MLPGRQGPLQGAVVSRPKPRPLQHSEHIANAQRCSSAPGSTSSAPRPHTNGSGMYKRQSFSMLLVITSPKPCDNHWVRRVLKRTCLTASEGGSKLDKHTPVQLTLRHTASKMCEAQRALYGQWHPYVYIYIYGFPTLRTQPNHQGLPCTQAYRLNVGLLGHETCKV